jgi:hypothetical protein
MPSSYFSERTLDEAVGAFMQTCEALDPHSPRTLAIVDAWRGVLLRLDKQIAIDQSVSYVQRAGEPSVMSPRMKRRWAELAEKDAQRAARSARAVKVKARVNSPPRNGQSKAPADWYSTDASAEQMTA